MPYKLVLFGASYYHEYMPYERLETGVGLPGAMRDLTRQQDLASSPQAPGTAGYCSRTSQAVVPEPRQRVLAMCYIVSVTVNVSVRLDDDLAKRLRLRARAAGETLSDRLRRYAEEGERSDEHPLVTFRDGPTGRRAGLVGGPDVWEVAMWAQDLAGRTGTAGTLAAESGLTRAQVEAALHYRDRYPDEVEARIELHRRETAAAEVAQSA